MAGTFTIIRNRIGPGGQMRGVEVKRVQQLLKLAGYSVVGTPDGSWGPDTAKAWQAHLEQRRSGRSIRSRLLGPDNDSAEAWRAHREFDRRLDYIDPADPAKHLLNLAEMAGVLMPLPNGQSGSAALKSFFDWVHLNEIPYGWASHGNGTMMTWGLENNPSWAICTKPGSRRSVLFDLDVPRSLNCTSLANILMSVWECGNLHGRYRASQDAGGFKNLSDRYDYPRLPGSKKNNNGLYTSLAGIKAVVRPGKLYHFGICNPNGYITHDTVLLDGEIYECNLDKTPACYKTKLEDRWRRLRNQGKYAIVSGPASTPATF